jgi:hypothetical protein
VKRGLVGAEEVEQAADLLAELGNVAHRLLTVDRVLVTSTDTGALDISSVDEIGHDSLRRPLGDPDVLGDVAKTNTRVSREAEEYLGVVREERP